MLIWANTDFFLFNLWGLGRETFGHDSCHLLGPYWFPAGPVAGRSGRCPPLCQLEGGEAVGGHPDRVFRHPVVWEEGGENDREEGGNGGPGQTNNCGFPRRGGGCESVSR